MIRRAYEWLIKIVEYWTIILLLSMVILVGMGVFYRYILNSSLSWYDEFAGYLLVWLTFYGAVLASYRNKHLGFETLIEKLPPLYKHWFEIMAELFVLALNIIILYYGWVLMQSMVVDTSISLPWIRMSWIYSVMPISGGLLTVVSIAKVTLILKEK